MEERVRATGHEHVAATHQSTFEVTTDDYLTPAGDCIIGVEADRAPADFAGGFAEACRDSSATIEARIDVGSMHTTVVGRGDEALTFGDERSLVVRTSDYVDDRTVMVGAGAAAGDLPRSLTDALATGAPLLLTLRVRP